MAIVRGKSQNPDDKSSLSQNPNKIRQQQFLKEQLSKKFFTRYGLDKICLKSSNCKRNETAIMKIIHNQFEGFITQKELT